MKKVFAALMLVAMGWAAAAQPVPQLDTMRGPDPTYFYPAHFWSINMNTDAPFFMWDIDGGHITISAEGRYSQDTLRVVGMAVAAQLAQDWDTLYKNRVLSLYSYGRPPVLLASKEVDITTADRWLEFENRDGYFNRIRRFTIPIQEVYFDDTIEVYDTFFVGIGLTQNMLKEAQLSNNIFTKVGFIFSYWHNPDGIRKEYLPLWQYYISTSQWLYGRPSNQNIFLFPILDTTGAYLHCAQFVCPEAENINVMQSGSIVMVRWTADTLQNVRWQVSYGQLGTPPESGHVKDCDETHTLLNNLRDSTRYVLYVRGYCTECDKWSEWSEGVEFYTGTEGIAQALPEESVKVWPNPARERFTVTSWVEMKEVRVYDVRGTLVERLSANGTTAEVEVRQWPAGVYYVAAVTRHGVERRRIVVE